MAALSDEVSAGDLRRSLEAQRDDLARRLEGAEDRDAAALHKHLTAVLDKLDRLPGGEEVSKLDQIADSVTDELAARRTDRKPAAKAKGRPRRRPASGS